MKIKMPAVNLNKEPTTREKVLFLIIIVISFVIFLNSVWSPRSKSINLLKANIRNSDIQQDAVKRLIDATKQQLDSVKDKPAKAAGSDPYVQRILERQVVDVPDEINTTVDIMGSKVFAKRANILKVEIGERKEESNYTIVPIYVDLEAVYPAFREYLKSLENIGRPLIVKEVAVREDEKRAGLLKVKIVSELFIAKT